jgi:hypothetical protein
MSRNLQITIGVALLLVVIFVVVHPLVDLDPTVCRKLQPSFLLLALLPLALALAVRIISSSRCNLVTDNSVPGCKDPLSRLDLTCTCLC